MGNMVFNARVKDDIGISSDGEEGSNSSDSRYALFIAQNLWISLKSTLILPSESSDPTVNPH